MNLIAKYRAFFTIQCIFVASNLHVNLSRAHVVLISISLLSREISKFSLKEIIWFVQGKKKKKNTVWCFDRSLLLVFCVCHGGLRPTTTFPTRSTGRKQSSRQRVFGTHIKRLYVLITFPDNVEASGNRGSSVSGLGGFCSALPTREALNSAPQKWLYLTALAGAASLQRGLFMGSPAMLSRFSSERGRRHSFVVFFKIPFPCQSPTVVTGGSVFDFLCLSQGIFFFFSSPGNQNETERVVEEDEGLVLDARNVLTGRKSLLYVRVFKMI